jgi:hypothetical protein
MSEAKKLVFLTFALLIAIAYYFSFLLLPAFSSDTSNTSSIPQFEWWQIFIFVLVIIIVIFVDYYLIYINKTISQKYWWLSAIIIIILSYGTFLVLLMIFKVSILSEVSLSFLFVATAAILIFFAYRFSLESNHQNEVKSLLNLATSFIFFGILLLEIFVFSHYFSRSQIPLSQCEKEEQPIDVASCILTGYKVSSSYESWQWASFWIFFIILPFAFIFSVTWGLIRPLAHENAFGKTVTVVITFIISSYATRQIFGAFLLDILGYGTLGVIGIFIPFLISFMIKRGFEIFLGPIQITEKIIYGAIGAHLYASVADIEKQLKEIQQAVTAVNTDVETLKAMKASVDKLMNDLEAIKKQLEGNKGVPSEAKRELLPRVSYLITYSYQLNQGIDEKQKRIQKGSGKVNAS